MDTDEKQEIEQLICEIGMSVSKKETQIEKPIVWAIAGSDSGGGAGIQADIKALNALGTHACSLVTAVTAQNSTKVEGIHYVPSDSIESQWETLMDDMPPSGIKFGMPGDINAIRFFAKVLPDLEVFKTVDPVWASSTGQSLINAEARQELMYTLLPYTDLLTPNIPEAELLLDRKIKTHAEIEAAAHDILKFGVRSVVIKGGHGDGGWSQDFWTNGTQKAWLSSPRLPTKNTHGTGCTFASAATACHALGYHELDSIVIAKTYVNQAISQSYATGSGSGTLLHTSWPSLEGTLPMLSSTPNMGIHNPPFASCPSSTIGLYPIVDRAEQLEKLIPPGVRTIQLRAKDLEGAALEFEVRRACEYAREQGANLYVNDAWELALECGAFGVHLGQDDLETANLNQIRKAGLRLGISTHSYTEIATAMTYRPSYIAVGTVFRTETKQMNYEPLGLDEFLRMAKLIPIPVVAIGGIHRDNAEQVVNAGANGIAVISEIRDSTDLNSTIDLWSSVFS